MADLLRRRATGAALALQLDAALGEPPNALHPVVAIGTLIQRLKPATAASPARELAHGAAITAAVVALASLGGRCAAAVIHRLPPGPRPLAEAAALKPAMSFRALVGAADRVTAPLERGQLDEARAALSWLCSRDPSQLDEGELCAAVIESLAENLSDSVIAPLLAWLAGGLPLAWAYRATNTLDAMIGYRGRYEYLGKVAARLDDVANLVPARLTAALLIAAAAATPGADAVAAARVAGADHVRTESPNAGWPMAAMAGALGVRLSKPGAYTLHDAGRAPTAADVRRAQELLHTAAALLSLGSLLAARPRFAG